MLVPLDIPPGMKRSGTRYQAKGRWWDGRFVRFFEESIRPIGSWQSLVTTTGGLPTGSVRSLLAWRNNAGTPRLAVGSNTNLYVFVESVLSDLTPPSSYVTTGSVSGSFASGLYGSGNYGASYYGVGDSTQSALTLGGLWSLDTFGQNLVAVLSSDGRLLVGDGVTPILVAPGAALGTLTIGASVPTAADTVTIGTTVYTWRASVTTTAYEVKIGATIAESCTNLKLAINAGPTGSGTLWGSLTVAHASVVAVATATTVVVYAKTGGTTGNSIVTTEAGTNTLWGGATLAGGVGGSIPTGNLGVVVTNERFVFLLGAGGDARAVQWPSQESLTDWTPSSSNTAGDFPLPGSGKLVCGRRGRNITLLFTDQDLFGAQYVGGTLVYAFTQLGSGCGIISPNAVAMIDGRAEWMGHNGFYQYDGFVRPIPCEVQDYVFGNLNRTQQFKCFAVSMPDFKEIWYFFPSTAGEQPDEPEQYVIHNYAENHWTVGQGLLRSAGLERGVFEYPFFAAPTGTSSILFEHERGSQDATGFFVESGPIEIGDGERIMDLTSLIPDQSTQAGEVLDGLQATLYTALYPTGPETTLGPYPLANPTDLRATARQVRLRIGNRTAPFVVVGSRHLSTSMDGVLWVSHNTDISDANLVAVVASSSALVVLTSDARIFQSTTGEQWKELSPNLAATVPTVSPVDAILTVFCFGGGRFVTLWPNEGPVISPGTYWQVVTSPDAITWTAQTNVLLVAPVGALVDGRGGAFGNGTWVLVGDGGHMAYSLDGVTWAHVPTSSFGSTPINGIGYGNGIFVAVGNTGKLATSPNGTTWTQRTSSFGSTIIMAVAFGNGLFVAVGNTGLVATSPDGITWTQQTANMGTDQLTDITFGNGLFVIGGAVGQLATSPDGVTWSQRASQFQQAQAITGLAYLAGSSTQHWRVGLPRLDVRPGSRR